MHVEKIWLLVKMASLWEAQGFFCYLIYSKFQSCIYVYWDQISKQRNSKLQLLNSYLHLWDIEKIDMYCI